MFESIDEEEEKDYNLVDNSKRPDDCDNDDEISDDDHRIMVRHVGSHLGGGGCS